MRLASVLLALGAGLEPASGVQASSESAWDAALGALREFRGGWKEVPSLHETLAGLGPGVSSGLFGALVAGELPAANGQAPEPLDPARALAVTLTLGLLPAESLRPLFDGVVASALSEDPRRRALELLARLGSAGDLQRAARLASVGTRATPVLQASYGQAVAQILAREPSALERFARDLPQLEPLLLSDAAGALSALGTRKAFAALASALDRRPEVDAVVLAELRRHAGEIAGPPSERFRAAIRASIRSVDPTVAALAASLAQAMRDAGATPDLIALLERHDGPARDSARSALRALTRLDLGADAEAWDEWYDGQERWASAELPAFALALRSGTVDAALAALQELTKHLALAEAVVPHLLSGLGRPEPLVVERTCAVIGRAGVWSAVPALIEALVHADAAVRVAAHGALLGITGLDLPPDEATWRFRITNLE